MGRAQKHIEDNAERQTAVILVVEDEPLLRMEIADYLRDVGHRVIEAGNAREAQAVLTAGEPVDIVFADVQLPGPIGGLSLAVWIRNNFPAIQVVLTSGNATVAESLQSQDPVPFIPKPYEPRDVADRIFRLLSQGRKFPSGNG